MQRDFLERVKSALVDIYIHDNNSLSAIGLEILIKAEGLKQKEDKKKY